MSDADAAAVVFVFVADDDGVACANFPVTTVVALVAVANADVGDGGNAVLFAAFPDFSIAVAVSNVLQLLALVVVWDELDVLLLLLFAVVPDTFVLLLLLLAIFM